MNTDLLIAIIIAGAFFLFLIILTADMLIREWIDVERIRKSNIGDLIAENTWTFAEK